MNRVREIIAMYKDPELKGAGMFAATMMEQDIKKAEAIITNGDVIDMLGMYEKLKTWES
ncbi:MAG: hypothetical protein QOA70_06825 [Nitrososphaeraceae archaeon]|nr:hypothetical protein [Nitrososphaeraceae archaeon]